MFFPACYPLLECKNHQGRHVCFMCSLKYSHHWQQCLPHSRQSIDTAELIDKLSPQPGKDDCYYSVQKLTISLLCTKSTTVKQQSWDSKTPCLPLREDSKEEEVLLYNLLYWTLSDHTPLQQPRPAAKTSEKCGNNWVKTSSTIAVGPATHLGAQAEKQAVILLLGKKFKNGC